MADVLRSYAPDPHATKPNTMETGRGAMARDIIRKRRQDRDALLQQLEANTEKLNKEREVLFA